MIVAASERSERGRDRSASAASYNPPLDAARCGLAHRIPCQDRVALLDHGCQERLIGFKVEPVFLRHVIRCYLNTNGQVSRSIGDRNVYVEIRFDRLKLGASCETAAQYSKTLGKTKEADGV